MYDVREAKLLEAAYKGNLDESVLLDIKASAFLFSNKTHSSISDVTK